MPLDRDIAAASALLIDGNARSRTMLPGCGVPILVQANSAEAVRRMLDDDPRTPGAATRGAA